MHADFMHTLRSLKNDSSRWTVGVRRGGHFGWGALLFVYWALTIPVLGQEIAVAAREYPMYRNRTLRLLEPLGALEEEERETEEDLHPEASTGNGAETGNGRGVAIIFEGVSVLAGGHAILHDVHLDIAPGSHVAVVGRSGAGKSTLLGLLLGWHRPAEGKVRIDGAPLTGACIRRLRRQTAWVDPSVRLWNRPLIENLHYGSAREPSALIGEIVETAGLQEVIESLPSGMLTLLGEGGGLVSGGEGQRVRFGRALQNPSARLAILDEPFRGLGREERKTLLRAARAWFSKATLLCVTQDISDSLDFDRVFVIQEGRVVEGGNPQELSKDPASLYAALLRAEKEGEHLWAEDFWKRLILDRGGLEKP